MLALNKIHHGDCLELMPKIPNESIDMILCDLPYGITRNKWDFVIPLAELWSEYKRIIKYNGIIALTCVQPFTSLLVTSNLPMYKHEWIWIKNKGSNFANTVREPMREHESVLIFSDGGYTYNKQMQKRSESGASRIKYPLTNETKTKNYNKFKGNRNQNLPEMRVPSSWQKFNTEVGLHPTQKPASLFQYLIKTYTNPGDTVLDNCIGSGTTAIAAFNIKRNFIGIEKSGEYVEVARQRIKRENQQGVLL